MLLDSVPEKCDMKIIKPHGAFKASVEINNLNNEVCKTIIANLHEKFVHGNRFFCRGSSDLYTPQKNYDPKSIDQSGENGTKAVEVPVEVNKPEVPKKSPTKNISADLKTIPGLPPQAISITKSQLRKIKKNVKSKAVVNPLAFLDPATQKALGHYNLKDFDFSDNDEDDESKDKNSPGNINIIEKLEKKRSATRTPDDERRIKPKSDL